MRLPSIKSVASELRGYKPYIEDSFVEESGEEPGMDVRLQYHDNGGWCLHTGDSQYDQDHRGHWGAGYLTRATNCRELAKELIDEVVESIAMSR